MGKLKSGFTSSLGEIPPRSPAPLSRHCNKVCQPPSTKSSRIKLGGTWIWTSGGKINLAAFTSWGNSAIEALPNRMRSEPEDWVFWTPGFNFWLLPSEWGCRITSWICLNSCAKPAMVSKACSRSEWVSPIPINKPVVNGTPSSPACLSWAIRRDGFLLGANWCTAPGRFRAFVVSSIRPMDAFTAKSCCISWRLNGPTLVCGRNP